MYPTLKTHIREKWPYFLTTILARVQLGLKIISQFSRIVQQSVSCYAGVCFIPTALADPGVVLNFIATVNVRMERRAEPLQLGHN